MSAVSKKGTGITRTWMSTRDMALVSLFAVLVGVGAMIRIHLPFSPVPLTLQTAMVLMAGLMLGARRGAMALVLYMIMGLLGLPVFAGPAGFQNVVMPSFGFIIGFIPAAWATGRICEIAAGRVVDVRRRPLFELVTRIVASTAGVVIYDVIGVLWLHMNINYVMGKSMTFYQSMAIGLFPFILTDLLKLVVVVLLITIISGRISSLNIFKQ